MINAEVEIEIGGKLEKIGKGAIKKALEQTMKETALTTEKDIVKEAPYLTGNLRRSINASNIYIHGFQIISGANYWSYVNYGTSKMNTNPFVNRGAEKIQDNFSKYLDKNLEKQGLKK